MDALDLVKINLQDFRVGDIEEMKTFKLFEICTICFKIVDAVPLNKLVFQNQKLQEILESTTSCFNFKDICKDAEEIISICHMCLQHLLISHLFQQKVQKSHKLFKGILNINVEQNNSAKKSENSKMFHENIETINVFLETDPLEDLKSDEDATANEYDNYDSANVEENYGSRDKVSRQKIVGQRATKKKASLAKFNKTCPICGKVFRRNCNVTSHMAVHTQGAQQKCKICSKKYRWANSLKRHMIVHTGVMPFICGKCGKGFIQKTQLIAHERIHTGKKFTCEICKKAWRTLRSFNRHMRNSHPTEEELLEPTDANVCEKCGKILSTKSALAAHMLLHSEKQFSCDYCQRKFTFKALLIAHSRIHTGEKPYKCGECGKAFRTGPSLYQHNFIHTGEKRYACHLCSMTFRQASHLKYHLHVHSGVKAFSCENCGKCFLTNGNLVAHKKLHAGIRPFACELCGQTFAAKNNLRRHERIHERSEIKRRIKRSTSD